MRRLADQVARSRRAQADLAGRQHVVGVTTGGGDFTISVGDSKLAIAEGITSGCEYTLVVDDPAVFTRWVRDGSLTDAAVEGTLWLPHREAFQLLPILDRLPRSTRRDLGDAVG